MKNLAKLEILNYITTRCIDKFHKDSDFKIGQIEKGNIFSGAMLETPPINSLCKLDFAPYSKYYLSWLRDTRKNNFNNTEYLLESIEDNEVCWWEGVTLYALPIETTNSHPEWQWTDEQFEFKKRWFKSLKNQYTEKALLPEFNDKKVVLKIREIFTQNIIHEKEFEDWKKIKNKDFQFWKNEISNLQLVS